MAIIKSICVYCGSQIGKKPAYSEAAHTLGEAMAKQNIRLVFGGGAWGIMGSVSDAVKANGGKVLGIIPEFLLTAEAGGEDAVENMDMIVTKDMHERKHTMFEHSDAFVALPGGVGTLEEIVEIMTWAQLGRHNKPMVFVNINGFWDPMISLLDHMREEGFLHSEQLMKLIVVDSAEAVVPEIINAAG